MGLGEDLPILNYRQYAFFFVRRVSERKGRTNPIVMLDGFRDEGVDEEGEFLLCGWHCYLFF